MRVLLDTNVILDLMLERDPWRAEAEAIAEAGADGRLQAHACASSITDIFYISDLDPHHAAPIGKETTRSRACSAS
jgi:predicted nucleic acid-binding protein